MRGTSKIAGFSAILVLVAACKQSEPTALPEGGPAFNFENAPDNTGVVVRRDNIPQGLSFCADGYCAYHGYNPVDSWCRNNHWNDTQWDWQVVESPTDIDNHLMHGQDVHMYIWPRGVNCDYMLNNDPAAEGLGNFRRQWRSDWHVFHWKAQAQLTGPGGEKKHYNGLLRYTKDATGRWHEKRFIKLN